MLFEFEEKELSHSVFQETPDVTFGCESGKLLDGVGASRGRESSQQTVGDFIMLKQLLKIGRILIELGGKFDFGREFGFHHGWFFFGN